MKPRFQLAWKYAIALRQELEINYLPFDMTNIYEIMGWTIDWSDAIRDPCEAITQEYKGRPCIFLPMNIKNRHRLKWSLGHEAGHIVLRHFKDFNLSPMHAPSLGGDTIKVLDAEANAFTAEFLIPKEFVVMNYHRGFEYLRQSCDVSKEAMMNRLDCLGFLSLVEAAPTTEDDHNKRKAPRGAFDV